MLPIANTISPMCPGGRRGGGRGLPNYYIARFAIVDSGNLDVQLLIPSSFSWCCLGHQAKYAWYWLTMLIGSCKRIWRQPRILRPCPWLFLMPWWLSPLCAASVLPYSNAEGKMERSKALRTPKGTGAGGIEGRGGTSSCLYILFKHQGRNEVYCIPAVVALCALCIWRSWYLNKGSRLMSSIDS